MARPIPPQECRCAAITSRGRQCRREREGDSDYCKQHEGKPEAAGLDPDILAKAAGGWQEVQSWVKEFPAGSLTGAKDVMTAIMARNYVAQNDRGAVSACRVLASLVQAEAAKLTAEKPITLVLGEQMSDEIGA